MKKRYDDLNKSLIKAALTMEYVIMVGVYAFIISFAIAGLVFLFKVMGVLSIPVLLMFAFMFWSMIQEYIDEEFKKILGGEEF